MKKVVCVFGICLSHILIGMNSQYQNKPKEIILTSTEDLLKLHREDLRPNAVTTLKISPELEAFFEKNKTTMPEAQKLIYYAAKKAIDPTFEDEENTIEAQLDELENN